MQNIAVRRQEAISLKERRRGGNEANKFRNCGNSSESCRECIWENCQKLYEDDSLEILKHSKK